MEVLDEGMVVAILGMLVDIDMLLLEDNNYEIVINFFILAITWHDIQQLSMNLPEFIQFVQLMNLQNNSCKLV